MTSGSDAGLPGLAPAPNSHTIVALVIIFALFETWFAMRVAEIAPDYLELNAVADGAQTAQAAGQRSAQGGAAGGADLEAVAQVGLLFPTTGDADAVAFNEPNEVDKQVREDAVVYLMREIRNGHASGDLSLDYTGKLMATKAFAAGFKEEAALVPRPGEHNTDCKGAELSRWRAEYSASSVFTAEKPENRFMPLSFYLEATTRDGRRVVHFGGVRQMKVQASQDLMINHPGKTAALAYRLELQLVDNNSENATEGSRENRMIDLVVHQQETRCIFSAITRNGSPYDIFISTLAVRLEREPVKASDPVDERFKKEGLTIDTGLKPYYAPPMTSARALIKFHGGRERMVSFALRSLPLVFADLTWSAAEGGKALKIRHGAQGALLPLEVHLRTRDASTDSEPTPMRKYNRFGVKEVLMRFNTEPRPPGDLRTDPAFLKGVQFRLHTDQVLAQDASSPGAWFLGGNPLPRDSLVDMTVLSGIPKAPLARVRNGGEADVVPQINGATDFKPFVADRYGGKIGLSLDAYQRAHAGSTKPPSDLRLEDDTGTARAGTTPTTTEAGTPLPKREKQEGDGGVSRFEAWVAFIQVVFLVAALLGWKASVHVVEAAALVSRWVCAMGAVALVATLYLELDGARVDLAPYLVSVCLALFLFVVVLGYQRSGALATGGIALVLMSAAVSMSLFVTTPPWDGAAAHQVTVDGVQTSLWGLAGFDKIRSLAVMLAALLLLALSQESAKIAARAVAVGERARTKWTTSLPNVALVITGALFLGRFFVLFNQSATRAFDGCLREQYQAQLANTRLNTAIASGDAQAQAQYEEDVRETQDGLSQCRSTTLSPSVSGNSAYPILTLSFVLGGVHLIGLVLPYALRSVAPARFNKDHSAFHVETGQDSMAAIVVQALLALAVLWVAYDNTKDLWTLRTPECDRQRRQFGVVLDKYQTIKSAIEAPEHRRILLNQEKEKLVYQEGCYAQSDISVVAASEAMGVLLLATIAAPLTLRAVSDRSNHLFPTLLLTLAATATVVFATLFDEPEERLRFFKESPANYFFANQTKINL